MSGKRQLHDAWVLALIAALGVNLAAAATAVAEDKKVRLHIEITAQDTGEPIPNATVYIKFKEKRFLWKDKKREWIVKTNPEGKAVLPLLPAGRVLVQVVAKRWKTYGVFHELKGPKYDLKIKLKRPKKWY